MSVSPSALSNADDRKAIDGSASNHENQIMKGIGDVEISTNDDHQNTDQVKGNSNH